MSALEQATQPGTNPEEPQPSNYSFPIPIFHYRTPWSKQKILDLVKEIQDLRFSSQKLILDKTELERSKNILSKLNAICYNKIERLSTECKTLLKHNEELSKIIPSRETGRCLTEGNVFYAPKPRDERLLTDDCHKTGLDETLSKKIFLIQ
jgi:hypothetical protein